MSATVRNLTNLVREMKVDALDHPKTLDLAARLSIELPTAIGHMELLFAFVGRKSPQGNVGKWPDGAIARACHWNQSPEQFIKALLDSKYLDKSDDHRLLLHDWHEHAPRWVRARLKQLGVDFLTVVENTGNLTKGTVDETIEESINGSGKDNGKGNGNEAQSDQTPEGEIPPGLNKTAWSDWELYRKNIRKPLKQASIPAAQRKLAAFGSQEYQATVVEHSIASGYQGLYEPRNGGSNSGTNQRADNSAPARVRAANGIER